jgi:hypothetical protein
MVNRQARMDFNHRFRERLNNHVNEEAEDDAFTPKEEER